MGLVLPRNLNGKLLNGRQCIVIRVETEKRVSNATAVLVKLTLACNQKVSLPKRVMDVTLRDHKSSRHSLKFRRVSQNSHFFEDPYYVTARHYLYMSTSSYGSHTTCTIHVPTVAHGSRKLGVRSIFFRVPL